MCGILQVIRKHRPLEPARFQAALASMKHRGPDATGIHPHPRPLALADGSQAFATSGHQRLAILDLDRRSNQPFVRGDRALVFNGEIYNFRELRRLLDDAAGPFTTTGDTEVLFRGLAHRGLDFLAAANGMWAFSYLDEQRGLLLAARDRYGKKPLFVAADDQQLVISSTVAAIHHCLGRRPRLDRGFADRYLAHGSAFPGPSGDTHFEGIQQVPAGCALRFDVRAWSWAVERCFDFQHAAAAAAPDDHALAELLRDAVRARLVSDRKVGLLLSGGIDSTLILSVLHALGLHDQVHCFIGETGRSEDAAWARRCVQQLGIRATVVDLDYSRNTLERVRAMARHHEKPFPFLGSSIAMAEMFQTISGEDVRVVLDGTGGDEVFGGYWKRYCPAATRSALATADVRWLRSTWHHAPRERPRLLAGTLSWASRGWLGTQRLKQLRSGWRRPLRLLGFDRRPVAASDPLAAACLGFRATVLSDVLPGGQLGEWIWHNDRNSMMWGIESRSPLLDHRLIPWIGVGYAAKFHHQWNKFPLRRAFDAFTPLPTQWRQQKQGFRWNPRAFLEHNGPAILEIIDGSAWLRARYRVAAYLDRARREPRLLHSPTTARLLCLAALDAELGLAPD